MGAIGGPISKRELIGILILLGLCLIMAILAILVAGALTIWAWVPTSIFALLAVQMLALPNFRLGVRLPLAGLSAGVAVLIAELTLEPAARWWYRPLGAAVLAVLIQASISANRTAVGWFFDRANRLLPSANVDAARKYVVALYNLDYLAWIAAGLGASLGFAAWVFGLAGGASAAISAAVGGLGLGSLALLLVVAMRAREASRPVLNIERTKSGGVPQQQAVFLRPQGQLQLVAVPSSKTEMVDAACVVAEYRKVLLVGLATDATICIALIVSTLQLLGFVMDARAVAGAAALILVGLVQGPFILGQVRMHSAVLQDYIGAERSGFAATLREKCPLCSAQPLVALVAPGSAGAVAMFLFMEVVKT